MKTIDSVRDDKTTKLEEKFIRAYCDYIDIAHDSQKMFVKQVLSCPDRYPPRIVKIAKAWDKLRQKNVPSMAPTTIKKAVERGFI